MCRTTATEAPTIQPTANPTSNPTSTPTDSPTEEKWQPYKEVTSGASCEAAGYVSIIDAGECKAANMQLSENNVTVKKESDLNQNRHDEPHGCIRNCWDDAVSCNNARLDLNHQETSSAMTEGCSDKLRCLCKG